MSDLVLFHPLAEEFPLLEGEDYADLVEDIRANGLIHAITLYQGQILDGRNRYRACRDAGVEPRFEEYTGDDPEGFVESKNDHRRHSAQEIQMARRQKRIARVKQASQDGKSQRQIAREEGVSEGQVRRDLKEAEIASGGDAPEIIDPEISVSSTATESARAQSTAQNGRVGTYKEAVIAAFEDDEWHSLREMVALAQKIAPYPTPKQIEGALNEMTAKPPEGYVLQKQGKGQKAEYRLVVSHDITQKQFLALVEEAREIWARLRPTVKQLKHLLRCDRSTFAPSIISGHAQVLDREIVALFRLLTRVETLDE